MRSTTAVRFVCLVPPHTRMLTQLRRVFGGSASDRFVEFYASPDDLFAFYECVSAKCAGCPLCIAGTRCPAWDGVDLGDYQPRHPGERAPLPVERIVVQPRPESAGPGIRLVVPADALAACAALGLAWPCTRAQVIARHRALALKHHCHAGGFSDVMVSVNTARDTLRALLPEETDARADR
ncbi:MAG: hypothetical protein ABI862_07875 [Ilumatobacteraceae bacterium]